MWTHRYRLNITRDHHPLVDNVCGAMGVHTVFLHIAHPLASALLFAFIGLTSELISPASSASIYFIINHMLEPLIEYWADKDFRLQW